MKRLLSLFLGLALLLGSISAVSASSEDSCTRRQIVTFLYRTLA